MRPRYPLQPLERVRELEVDERERALASSVLKVRHTRELRAEKEASLAGEQERSHRTRTHERQHLVSGTARAVDLARSAEFELGAKLREADRKQELEGARKNERAAEKAEQEARAELARAEARQKALGRHRQRFEQGEARAAEREAEDDAQDLHRHGAREGHP